MNAALKNVVPVKMRGVVRDSLMVLKYATPNPFFSYGRMSEKARNWADTLRRDGIIKIEGDPSFVQVADYLDRTYFEYLEKNKDSIPLFGKPVNPWNDERTVQNVNAGKYSSAGTEIGFDISFKDPNCAPLFLNHDLLAALGNYYRRQPYYRNQPFVQKIALNGQVPVDNGNIHVDHLHQVSFMLLVSDVTMKDTHMEYCRGAHRRNVLKEGILTPMDRCLELSKRYPVMDCVGKKGTLFVFDAGGFHRANYIQGSTRKMLHCNITTGHHLGRFHESAQGWDELSKQPAFVRNMFRFMNLSEA